MDGNFSKCRYYKRMKSKGYSRCKRDNSIRKEGCPCSYYRVSPWTRFLNWLYGYRN